MRKCSACREEKLENKFCKNLRFKDGLNSICKSCSNYQCRQYYKKNRKKVIAQKKKYSAQNKEKAAKRYKRHRQTHPKEIKAKSKIYAQVKNGNIVRQPCRDCGHPVVDAHHPDYDKPLDVVWLCRTHHNREHSRLREVAQYVSN